MQDEDMAKKILDNGPWSIMKQFFPVKRWPSELAIEEVDMINLPFWVQIRGIPLNLCMEDNAEKLGNKIGEVLQYDSPNQARGYLRLSQADENETWAEFQYERLSDLCYKCGRIGHLNTDCSYEATSDGTAGYGTWTKAKIIRELENQPKPTALSTGER
ncbi:unnamed protein product [Prunus armeniaca]